MIRKTNANFFADSLYFLVGNHKQETVNADIHNEISCVVAIRINDVETLAISVSLCYQNFLLVHLYSKYIFLRNKMLYFMVLAVFVKRKSRIFYRQMAIYHHGPSFAYQFFWYYCTKGLRESINGCIAGKTYLYL